MADEAEDAGEDIDTDAEGGEGEGEAKKGGLKKLILFVGLPAIIVILGGVAGALMFLGGGEEEVVADADGELVEEAPTDVEQAVAYYEMEESDPIPILADLDVGGRSPALLKLDVVLVYNDPELAALLERDDVTAHLTDTYMEFVRTLRVEDVNGSMGTYRLRAELLRRTNLVIAPARAERILLPEFLVQQ